MRRCGARSWKKSDRQGFRLRGGVVGGNALRPSAPSTPDPAAPKFYDALRPMAATAVTEPIVPRQHGGNSTGVSSSRASAADSAPRLTPVTASVTAEQRNGPFTDEVGLLEPYRYGNSNPGFRTEKRKLPN